MPTFLQAIDLPERCFLEEALYWVAFLRLPVAYYTDDGSEIRQTEEVGGYAIALTDGSLTRDETSRLGIPVDPDWIAWTQEGRSLVPVAFYDDLLAKHDVDAGARNKIGREREEAIESERKRKEWAQHYTRALEYPSSRIFVALRDGSLPAKGRLLPAGNLDEARSKMEDDGRSIFELPVSDIPPIFWSLQGIDFDTSAAGNGVHYYCHVSCRTEDLIKVFPGEREEVSGILRIGDSYVLSEAVERVRSTARRGRPPYPWDKFHVEVASLIKRDEMPRKKEAAIEYFRDWFGREHKIRVSRSVVGEKLKPYYDRILKANGRKID